MSQILTSSTCSKSFLFKGILAELGLVSCTALHIAGALHLGIQNDKIRDPCVGPHGWFRVENQSPRAEVQHCPELCTVASGIVKYLLVKAHGRTLQDDFEWRLHPGCKIQIVIPNKT